jgi:DNA sulfur modification protein DndB
MSEFTYTFGAILGQQNGRPFYQATVPFRTLASMLKLDEDFDVNKRSQRLVDTTRAKKVAKYLHKNINGFFVIPPLVGFIEGDFEFESVPIDGFGNVGRMKVDLDARFMLFDGQHRAFGIREAMALAPELGQQNVSIMFFAGMSLSERQQAFHDINFTQKTPAAALCIAYNSRSDFDKMVTDTFSKSSIRGIIEYEKNTASGKSNKIYSLKTLKDFATNFCGKDIQENTQQLLAEYIKGLFTTVNIPAHLSRIEADRRELLRHGFVCAKYYRENYILPHAVTLKALGLLGRALLSEHPYDWHQKLEAIGNISVFDKHAEHWLGRCVNEREKMVSNQLAVRLTFYKLKELCGLALAPEEKVEEGVFSTN